MAIKILKNVKLSEFTTMGVGGLAENFIEVSTQEDLKESLEFAKTKRLKIYILGEGSNTLVSDQGVKGLVVKNKIQGIVKKNESQDWVEFEVGAGEHWDDFVVSAVNNNLFGIENMSHVPGSVGASVVQNIGCYGQEVSETVVSVNAVDLVSFEEKTFSKEQINFGYRKSRFNDINQDKGKFVITSVCYRLRKLGEVNSNYGDVQKYFIENNIIKPNLQIIREALIKIRDKKFPYPGSLGNGSCGSFFKADVIGEDIYEKIIPKLTANGFSGQAEYLVKMKDSFKVSQGYKIPYGLLIESLGFKGKINGGAKILESHAGVINNFNGKATARDVYSLAQRVINDVYEEYGVKIQMEPEIIGDFS